MENIDYSLIFVAAFLAIASPGPATLAIANTSMSQGRVYGLSIALGVLTGSLLWSVCAAFGLATLMFSNVWLLETFRYVGSIYLLFLAYKSLLSAWYVKSIPSMTAPRVGLLSIYYRGLLIHITNPKAVLFFGALYSIVIPVDSSFYSLLKVIGIVALVSSSVFISYALIFSSELMKNLYMKTRKAFETIFALFFGTAALRILFSNIDS